MSIHLNMTESPIDRGRCSHNFQWGTGVSASIASDRWHSCRFETRPLWIYESTTVPSLRNNQTYFRYICLSLFASRIFYIRCDTTYKLSHASNVHILLETRAYAPAEFYKRKFSVAACLELCEPACSWRGSLQSHRLGPRGSLMFHPSSHIHTRYKKWISISFMAHIGYYLSPTHRIVQRCSARLMPIDWLSERSHLDFGSRQANTAKTNLISNFINDLFSQGKTHQSNCGGSVAAWREKMVTHNSFTNSNWQKSHISFPKPTANFGNPP